MSDIKSGDYAKSIGKRTGIPIDNNFLSRLPGTGIILDLGCGGGDHARSLAELGHTIYACDPWIGKKDCMPKPSEEIIANGKVIFLDATDESLPDRVFDAIWMNYSLPFVDDVNTCLMNLSNHLKTGGVLYTSFFEPRGYDNRKIEQRTARTFTPKELARNMEECQLPFKIEHCELLPPPPLPKEGQPSGIQNRATILISRKIDSFSKDINLHEDGSLKIEKSGWKGKTLTDSSQGFHL